MKNILFNLLFISTLLCMGACNILDQKSPNDIAADDFFTEASEAENALIGLYNTLQKREYLGGNYELFPDAYAGIATVGGYDVASLNEFGERSLTSSNLYCASTYIAMYYSIANANRLLDGLENIPAESFADGRKERIAAEARFIRAMAHFDLLRWFGYYWDENSDFGIPIVDHVTTINEVILRNKVSENYAFIIAELEGIRSAFPADEERNPNFINISVVDALLARVYLYAGEYAKAYQKADAVLQISDAYALGAPDFYSTKKSKESVFELAFDIRNQSSFFGQCYLRIDALRPELSFLAAESMDSFFVKRPNDLRSSLLEFDIDSNIMPDGRTLKYQNAESRDDPAYLIRTAEMYLIRAEAGQQNGSGDPLADLNALRTARGMDALPDLGDWATTLSDEYKAEFNFEGLYLYTLVRLGKFEEITSLPLEKATFPIPAREVSVSLGRIVQNPGY